jgi:hypothetical protein
MKNIGTKHNTNRKCSDNQQRLLLGERALPLYFGKENPMHAVTAGVADELKRTYCSGFGVLVAIFMAANLVSYAGQPESPAQTNNNPVTVAQPATNLVQKWGIQVSGLFLSGGGNLVDFRYVVVDPAKATFLSKPENKPQLLDQTSGAKLIIPNDTNIGPLRQTPRPPAAGKTYFMLFANTRHHVKSGDKVTIVAGDMKLEGLTVE